MEEEEAHGSDGLGDGGGLDEVSSPPQAEVSQAPQAQHASSLYAAEETTARAQTNNQLPGRHLDGSVVVLINVSITPDNAVYNIPRIGI